MQQPSTRRDVVVVGGGIAGMVAAVRAAELGLRATVLEQGRDVRYPCNTRFSGGILHAAYHDVMRSEDELRAIIAKATRDTASRSLTDSVARDGRRLLAWLRGHDVRFMRVGVLEAHRWCIAPPRPIVPGLIEWQGRGPDVMLRTLADRLRDRGGELLLGVRARELVMRDGRCAGLAGERNGEAITLAADAVVIADGGFQANADLFRRFIGPSPERVLQRGAATGRGDGLAMALDAGAASAGMGAFYGHLMSRAALTNPRVWPYPELDGIAAAAIVVGPDGRRLLDEGLGGIAIANALARLHDPACATIVLDAAIWDGPGRSARIPANPFLERYGGALPRAQTLDGLADAIGVPRDALAATVQAYNAALDGGRLASLDPPRSADRIKAWPIRMAPFIAIPMCVGITHTMGGIVIDGDGCVLRHDGSRIAGLYAAGSTTAGLEGDAGGGRVGYVGGLIKSVFGLRAAEHIARVRADERGTVAAAS